MLYSLCGVTGKGESGKGKNWTWHLNDMEYCN